MPQSPVVALLEPAFVLQALEANGNFTSRLALLEELKSFPHGAVWDYYCLHEEVPVGQDWLVALNEYERSDGVSGRL